MTEKREAAIAAAVDELTELLIDRVLPVAQRYRVALADRLGLGLPELLCVDLLRRLGPLPAGAVAERRSRSPPGCSSTSRTAYSWP